MILLISYRLGDAVKPIVSIIIPTYNRIERLAELIESLYCQTFQDFEIIIVNDCGKPVEIIKELYPELVIHICNLVINSKHVVARNEGLKLAEGEFILLCDDDDLLMPTHIESLIEHLPYSDFVYTDVEIVNYQLVQGTRIPINRRLFAYKSDFEQMRKFSTFVSSGCIYRKKIHDEIGLFDEEVYNYWDWDFFLRVAQEYKVTRVPIASVLYEFSSDSNNASKEMNKKREGYLNKLCQKHQLGPLPQKNFFMLLEEPEIKTRKANSKIIWDGNPIISRYAGGG